MNSYKVHLIVLGLAGALLGRKTFATNPLITNQFTADPTARVFDGKMYVYPSHDILASLGKGRVGWFCMEDYHVFSSDDLNDWKDHGVIVSQDKVDWVDAKSYSMWAPDCVFKNGKYYFYFPATAKNGGFRIGVATSDKPYGPFKPETTPIEGIQGIDPCVFIDKDGQAYIYYSQGKIFVAKLKDNMMELDSLPRAINNLPATGLLEGPFVFERNGIYYLTYPHVQKKIERLEYSIGDNPLGPFKPTGVILDESASGCWTVHHSIVQYKDRWHLFYHDRDLSPDFDKNRSIRADYLAFNEDGTIKKVVPTLRGVGLVDAKSQIQIDRYSEVSGDRVSASFLDSANKALGWKISLPETNSWVRFNNVDFGAENLNSLSIKAISALGANVELRLDTADGTVLGQVEVAKGAEWKTLNTKLNNIPTGVHDLFVKSLGDASVDIDWVTFK
ncbi:carbohydrate-binding protein [bacterium]|nr:MAG: carbohydrate-binding protein [bacterium]